MSPRGHVIITGAQVRMARAALAWRQAELADKAGVSDRTVKRLEQSAVSPTVTVNNYRSIIRCLEEAGIVFISAGLDGLGAGVRFREESRSS